MPHARFERRIADLLAEADVRIGGNRPWDIQVHDPRFHARVLGQGSLGLGESYMDGWWDAASLDGLLFHLLAARVDERVHGAGEIFDAFACPADQFAVATAQRRRRATPL